MGQIIELAKSFLPIYRELKQQIPELYYHSHIFFNLGWDNYRPNNLSLDFTLDDILIICALVQESVLLTGSSGSGKSFLCEIIGKIMFGDNQVLEKTITSEMGIDDFCDIDFGKLLKGSTLTDAIESNSMLIRPMCILNEANRAPPLVQNVLFQLLDNNLNVKSKHIPLGITLDANGKLTNFRLGGRAVEHQRFYFWNVLTVNEGTEFSGAQKMDRALLDRITVEIEMDKFPPTFEDQIKMVVNPKGSLRTNPNNERNILFVYKAKNIIEKNIDLSTSATAFILMLGWLSYCDYPDIINKKRVNFRPLICSEKKCKYANDSVRIKICSHASSISNRMQRKLVVIAKALVFLKIVKTLDVIAGKSKLEELENNSEFLKFKNAVLDDDSGNAILSLDDIGALSPVVLRSKIDLHEAWIAKEYLGNKINAVRDITDKINEDIQTFKSVFYDPIDNEPSIHSRIEKIITSINYATLKAILTNENLPAIQKLKEFIKELKNNGIDLKDIQKTTLEQAINKEFRILYLIEWALYVIAKKKKII